MRYFVALAILALALLPDSSWAAKRIHIAAYEYPPYFSTFSETHLLGDLVELLNRSQRDYEFVIHDIPSKARFKALSSSGCCHMMLFESPEWGWSESLPEVEFGQTLVKGAGRLIALNKKQRRDQAFFNREGLRFGGIIGYHYSFLNNRTDAELLEQRYNVYLSLSHQVNLKMLLNNRLDVVMIHDQYLVQLQDEPWFDRLLLQSQPYMEYDLRSVINPRKGFTLSEWQGVLQPRIDDGSFAALLARYHLPWPPRPLEL